MNIDIEFIKPEDSRYITLGDYYETPDGDWVFRVVDTGNWKYNFLVLWHEMAEFVLVKDRGISEKEITAFDKNFERERAEGKHSDAAQPGFDRAAPYIVEHTIADTLERTMASLLNVDWGLYDKELNEIDFPKTLLDDYRDELGD